jgi:hypothetical protein
MEMRREERGIGYTILEIDIGPLSRRREAMVVRPEKQALIRAV